MKHELYIPSGSVSPLPQWKIVREQLAYCKAGCWTVLLTVTYFICIYIYTHQQVSCYLLEFAPGSKQQVVWKLRMKHCTSSDRMRHALCTLWCSGLAQSAHRGYDAVSLSEWFRTFRKILHPLSSRVNESNNTSGEYNFFFRNVGT